RLEVEGFVAATVFDDQGRPGDVGGHQVRGELDPTEVEVKRLAQRADEQRLLQAGRALEEDVPTGEDGREDAAHHLRLADDGDAQRLLDALRHGPKLLRTEPPLNGLHLSSTE